jgi:hypothetical protein
MWKGKPQFAKDTKGPFSNKTISDFSESLLARAAQEAPPATPPTMRTRF